MNYNSTEKLLYYIFSLRPTLNYNVCLSPTFFRTQKCPSKCGSCCVPVTLDYYPGERWENFKKTFPELTPLFTKRDIDSKIYYSFIQQDISKNLKKCIFLNETGRCEIHGVHPFLCDFEPRKIYHNKNMCSLSKRLLTRAWHLTKVDLTKGIACSWDDNYSDNAKQHDVKLLQELKEIAVYFNHDTSCIDKIIEILLNFGKDQYIIHSKEIKNV